VPFRRDPRSTALLIGDSSGHCHVEVTRRYFRNQVFVIAGDDNFANRVGQSRRSSMSVGFVVRCLSWLSVALPYLFIPQFLKDLV